MSASVDVGRELARFTMPVDASKAREMAVAVRAHGWAQASATDLRGRVVVPTFTQASAFWQDRYAIMRDDLALDMGRVLHGEQRWHWNRPVRVGDVLHGTTRLADVSRITGRRGGEMRRVTMATEYGDGTGEPVLEELMTVLETSAAPAASATPAAPAAPAAPAGNAAVAPVSVSRRATEPGRGDPLGEWTVGAIERRDIVRYAGASGDFNPIHTDEPYAHAQGLPSVFSMGMLQGGIVGLYLFERVPEGALRTLSLRFLDRLWPGEELVVAGWWTEDAGGCVAEARTHNGRLIVSATATIDQ
jgi:peroxisomal enoyl-CoA hydratase 2